MTQLIHPDAIDALVSGEIGAPSTILGRHQLGDEVSIRVPFGPGRKQSTVVDNQYPARASAHAHDSTRRACLSLSLTRAGPAQPIILKPSQTRTSPEIIRRSLSSTRRC